MRYPRFQPDQHIGEDLEHPEGGVSRVDASAAAAFASQYCFPHCRPGAPSAEDSYLALKATGSQAISHYDAGMAAIVKAAAQELENFKKAYTSNDLRSAETQLGQLKVC